MPPLLLFGLVTIVLGYWATIETFETLARYIAQRK